MAQPENFKQAFNFHRFATSIIIKLLFSFVRNILKFCLGFLWNDNQILMTTASLDDNSKSSDRLDSMQCRKLIKLCYFSLTADFASELSKNWFRCFKFVSFYQIGCVNRQEFPIHNNIIAYISCGVTHIDLFFY